MPVVNTRLKAAGSLVFGIVLLLPVLFFWWKLAYLHNLPDGGSAVIWKKVEFGPMLEDLSQPAAQLRYNLGFLPEKWVLKRFAWSSPEIFWVVGGAMTLWGLIQVALVRHFLRQRH